MNDVKPCPFCGSTNIDACAALSVKNEQHYVQSGCRDCGALGPIKAVIPGKLWTPHRADRAANAWNIRATG